MKIFRTIAAGAGSILLAATLAACSTGPSSDDQSSGGDVAEDCTPTYEFSTLKEGVLQVAGMNEMPSFLANSASGPFEGFNATLMTEFAEQNCLKLEWTPGTGPATQLLAADGKVDAWVGIIVATPARGEVLNLPEHQLYWDFAGIASRTDDAYTSVDDLKGLKIGAVTGSYVIPPAEEAFGEGALTLYQSSDEAFQDLSNGRVDAVLTPSSPQAFWVSDHPDAGIVSNIIEESSEAAVLTQAYKVTWPVNKDNAELTKAISSYFEEINSNGRLKELLSEVGITDELHTTGR